MGLWDVLKGGIGGIGNLFSGMFGGNSAPKATPGGINFNTPIGQNPALPYVSSSGMNASSGMNGGVMGSIGRGIKGLFTGGEEMGSMARGAATMLGSQLISNPKPPQMPDSYNRYMEMMQGGGTPGMQAANQYYMGVLSGSNQDAYEAAAYSLDQNYQEQLRQLNAMYKSLRPGTDPTSDSTYQRDLSQLNDQYARARAQVMAGVQQGAAQGAAGLGTQQMAGMQSGIQSQLDNVAAQWGMNAQQKEALRNQLLGLGVSQLDPNQAIYQKLFGRMFGGG